MNTNKTSSLENERQSSYLGAVSGIKIKLILSILCVWIAYGFGCLIAYETNNAMIGFGMVMVTITMIPLMATGAVIDYFR